MVRSTIIAGVFAALMLGAMTCVQAQDCPRGDLDKAYCDRNGDLVADAPTDPKQLVNPSTLIFARSRTQLTGSCCSSLPR